MPLLRKKKIRYAVVGLGHIAQAAVLPGFAHAKRNSELVAFVSDDPIKHQKLGEEYEVKRHYSYDRYDECLHSGEIDAVYICLPNHMHCEYAVRAANAGIHVLCEKPLAISSHECRQIINACDEHGVKLMTAYRLHFERTNLKAIDIVQSGQIGTPQIFNSVFAFQVRQGDIRVRQETGGGTLFDIGVYCINAARYLFRDEPFEVFATSIRGIDERFREVDAITSAILRFPNNRVANFTTSFASASIGNYTVLGTKGYVRLDRAYEYETDMRMTVSIDGEKETCRSSKRDQFGPEVLYFSKCILKNENPEPSGLEGLIDIQIVEALYQSAHDGRPITVEAVKKLRRPTLEQEIHKPAPKEPELVNAQAPSVD